MVAAVADSMEFEHKYRSIVIAWAPESGRPTAQINAVFDDYEKTARAGLEPDRYAWTGGPLPRARRRRPTCTSRPARPRASKSLNIGPHPSARRVTDFNGHESRAFRAFCGRFEQC